jgi:two-component system OmpR family sensor kinase
VIEVADEGPGLPPGEAENLFRRFYRADASRSRDSGGVGLGLSIVAAIAQAHEGSVGASNGPTGGAVFRITLPLLKTTS